MAPKLEMLVDLLFAPLRLRHTCTDLQPINNSKIVRLFLKIQAYHPCEL